MEEMEYFLGWQLLLPGSAKRVWYLIECFGSAEGAWKATEKQLLTTGGFTSEAARDLVLRRRAVNPEAERVLLEKMGIAFLYYNNPGYPEMLKAIFDPPPGLFVRGKLIDGDSQSVAIVGSRKATGYGLAVAAKLAGELASSGVTIISGMARGIDTAAHRGALSAGKRTIAVLGCGMDVPYPRENLKLMEEIAQSGAVISEFPLRSAPEPWHFPVRNRVISGLSKGVVVVEAAERSGALITADFALDQGRDVMAVPGNISSLFSRGPNRLIRQGARLVESADDILDELGFDRLFREVLPEEPGVKLSAEESVIRKMLNERPVTLDYLVEHSGLTVQRILVALTYLELKGLVRQMPGRLYSATR